MGKVNVAPGVYHNPETNRFTYRPWVRGRRTERTLQATTLKEAIREYHLLNGEAQASKRVDDLFDAYLSANAPDRAGNPRDVDFVAWEKRRIKMLRMFFGKMDPAEIRLFHCLEYRDWRVKKILFGKSGLRTVDMELGTLSNALNYALLNGEIELNPIFKRPRFNQSKLISHCRDHCPRSGDELHLIANKLFEREDSIPMGWQMLFEATSGCRTGEALALRWDAEEGRPGHIRDGKYLCIGRLKQGDDDPFEYIEMNHALKLVVAGIKRWNKKGPFFKSFRKESVIGPAALSHALRRILPELLPGRSVTSHGMRAFYVTWRRASGIPVYQIAEEIGHRSGVALIYSTYGRKLPPWASKTFSPYPETVDARW